MNKYVGTVVYVTDKEIKAWTENKGYCEPCKNCAIAKALQRTFKLNTMSCGYEIISNGIDENGVGAIPSHIKELIHRMDNGQVIPAFSFTIEEVK